jgi:hypothetical protein
MWALGLAVCSTVILCFAVSLWLTRRKLLLLEHQVTSQIMAFVSSPADGQPSALAQLVQIAGRTAGAEVAASLKGAFMGHSSALAKAETAMVEDVLVDSASAKSPVLGLLLSSFPRLAKRLAKSPAAAAAFNQIDLDRLLGGGGNGAGAAPESTPRIWSL